MGSSERKYNGHAGLGAELKRLRGGRTLQQIAELSKTPPLGDRIKPVAAPTLSLIENGVSLPSLESLYSLSVIYRVPMQRLWEIVGLERMVAAVEVPGTPEAMKSGYRTALLEQRWFHALSLALAGEAIADDSVERLRWRHARAACMTRVGMQQEALLLLHEISEDPRLPESAKLRVLHDLAEAQASAGFYEAAAATVHRVLDQGSDETLASTRGSLLFTAARALINRQEVIEAPRERDVREALAFLQGARRHLPDSSPWRELLTIAEASARHLLGNGLLALKMYEETAASVEQTLPALAAHALVNAAQVRRASGHLSRAARSLARAEELALQSTDAEAIFNVSVEWLSLNVSADRALSERYQRRCERYFPLLNARTPFVLRYERMLAQRCGS